MDRTSSSVSGRCVTGAWSIAWLEYPPRPTLLLSGRHDRRRPPPSNRSSTTLMTSDGRSSKTRVHMPFVEETDAYMEVVDSFLASVDLSQEAEPEFFGVVKRVLTSATRCRVDLLFGGSVVREVFGQRDFSPFESAHVFLCVAQLSTPRDGVCRLAVGADFRRGASAEGPRDPGVDAAGSRRCAVA